MNNRIGSQNWFSLLAVGSSLATGTVAFNSQAFWLPMPADGDLTVTHTGAPLTSGACKGDVEIHGFYPGG